MNAATNRRTTGMVQQTEQLQAKAPTHPTLSYTGHIMKQSNLIKREQTGQSLQSTTFNAVVLNLWFF
jgi:hypothetical protein